MTAIPSPAALGIATCAARKQLGLTQPQLALASGVGVRFVVEMEAGKPTLRLEHILRVLHALGEGWWWRGCLLHRKVHTKCATP